MTAPPVAARARGHVYAADVVRVLTFAGVIGVHVFSSVNGSANVTSNGVVMLLHFTREAFFVLTGFVLVHQYYGRSYRVTRFYGRRLLTVGVPYVVWSGFYTWLTWYSHTRAQGLKQELQIFGHNLLYGTAYYHMYFLLVSLQVYLLYPVIAGLLRLTRRHHVALLSVSAALEVATTAYIYTTHTTGNALAGVFLRHDNILVVTYQFWVLLGAVAAVHLEQISDWVRHHRVVVVAWFVASGAGVVAWYLHTVSRGVLAATATGVFQPVMVSWSVGVVAMLFLLGLMWSRRRHAGSLPDRFLAAASDRSFGIYLSHPAVLWLLFLTEPHWLPAGLPAVVQAAAFYVLTVVGAVVVTEILRRSPMSLPLTGRGRRRASRPVSVPTREEPHAPHDSASPDAGDPAQDQRSDDGDRQRPADPAVRRHSGELQRAD